jgi:2-keto-4-pentenoate hydratase/2-oxohepta-3-ene-1,7-dioic acid hydratase in catechol pathway
MEDNFLKFVRYAMDGRTSYGILKDCTVIEIQGSIFDNYEPTGTTCELDDVRLLAPVEPSKIICVGLNYLKHINELKKERPLYPSHFLKAPSAVINPGDSIILPPEIDFTSYEGELAFIIKDKMKDVPEDEALDHVLGYTCLNDITARDLIGKYALSQFIRAKGFDTFAPFGPCVATDLNPSDLTVRTFLNQELVQEGKCSDMIFSVAYLVHYLSQCMTFFPGDIISTGTPSGIKPLQDGDTVAVSIEGIGTLQSPVRKSK